MPSKINIIKLLLKIDGLHKKLPTIITTGNPKYITVNPSMMVAQPLCISHSNLLSYINQGSLVTNAECGAGVFNSWGINRYVEIIQK